MKSRMKDNWLEGVLGYGGKISTKANKTYIVQSSVHLILSFVDVNFLVLIQSVFVIVNYVPRESGQMQLPT